MGDYSWGRIEIGGPIKRSVLEELITEEEMDLDDDGLIVIEEDETRGGQFDIEDSLVEAGIAFNRYSGRHYTWNPSCRRNRPGIGDFEHTTDDDDDDRWNIQVDEVRKKLAEGPDALRTHLDEKYPDLPKLEPITWLPEDAEIDAALGA